MVKANYKLDIHLKFKASTPNMANVTPSSMLDIHLKFKAPTPANNRSDADVVGYPLKIQGINTV